MTGSFRMRLWCPLTARKLEAEYSEMTAYGSGAPTVVEIVTVLNDWPEKRAGDAKWVYVAMANDTYSEAVAVVSTESGKLGIRDVEWGRP